MDEECQASIKLPQEKREPTRLSEFSVGCIVVTSEPVVTSASLQSVNRAARGYTGIISRANLEMRDSLYQVDPEKPQ